MVIGLPLINRLRATIPSAGRVYYKKRVFILGLYYASSPVGEIQKQSASYPYIISKLEIAFPNSLVP